MKKICKIIIFSALIFVNAIFFNIRKLESSYAITSFPIYNISNENEKIRVVNSETEMNCTFDNFSLLLTSLRQNAVENNFEILNLNFDNFNLDNVSDENININDSTIKYCLSGKLSSEKTNPLVIISSNNANISIKNISFECQNTDLAIKLLSNNCIVTFCEKISHDNNYLINYKKTSNFYTSNISSDNKLNILLPYDLYSDTILSLEEITDEKAFCFCSKDGYFIGKETITNTKKIIANSYIKYVFEQNGGIYKDSQLKPNFNQVFFINELTFPTEDEIGKNISYFNGWFGKFNYNEKTYYFDSKMLEEFSKQGYSLSLIDDYFATSLENVRKEYSFSKFNPNSTNKSIEEYQHTLFFIENGKTPTYIAKWEYMSYSISFETNCDEKIDMVNFTYSSKINISNPTERVGYNFEGWFEDKDFTKAFNRETMPAENLKLYAKWSINQYTISFDTDNGSEVKSITKDYLSNVTEPKSPTKKGYKFVGWYKDKLFSEEYIFTTMPSENITVYAKWDIIKIKVYFNDGTENTNSLTYVEVDYGSTVKRPSKTPTKIGCNFVDWYYRDNNVEKKFDFLTQITSQVIIYAKYEELYYTITFVTNCDYNIDSMQLKYNETITQPNNPEYKNHLFEGWFEDNKYNTKYVFDKMPATNLTLYAMWKEKESIEYNFDVQNYDYGNIFALYKISSELTGFYRYYFVDNEWTAIVPTELGSYDVKIVREEDSKYASFETIIENGFVINPSRYDVSWLILIFYILTFIEIGLVFFVKKMKKMKISNTYSVLIGTSFISTGQFIHLIISGLLFLFGFIYLIYELVATHKTVNNENFLPSSEDNRERFKDDLVFQNNVLINPDFEYETKIKDSFGEKYSNADIEKMLINDTFNEDRLKNKKHTNATSENETKNDSENKND